MEQKWKDALDIMAAESAGWASSMPELRKTMPPTRRENEAKVSSRAATVSLAGYQWQLQWTW